MATWTSQRTGTWSDDAANASSPWNGGGNPATGVPASGDTVTIASSHVVTFNVDQSGFASGITLTITGTLEASTTAGTYKLKLGANLAGAGTLRAGTSGTPYPSNCTFEIIRNGNTLASSTMTYDLNCAEPTVKWVRLSAQEAAAQTVLSVDTDVTGDPLWTSGATLRICDVNAGNDNEERTFSSATSNTITISSGLTNQKESGAYIILISRNVRITHTSVAGTAISGATLGRILAEVNNAVTGYSSVSNLVVGGSVTNFTTGANGFRSCTVSAVMAGGATIVTGSGSVFLSTCIMAGATNGFSITNGCTFFGTIAGCAFGVSGGSANTIYGSIIGCSSGFNSGGGHTLSNATLQSNTNDFQEVSNIRAFNTLFGSATENNGYNGALSAINNFVESFDHDQVANAYRAWTKGGIVDSDTGTVYTGRTRSYKHACTSASFYTFQNRTFTVQPSGGLVVQCYVRKSATMSYLPRVWILTPGQEPFVTGSPAHEDIMTDSVDTWEELNLVYANGGTSPVDVVVRTIAKNASGNVFFDPIVTVLAPATYDVYNTLLGYIDTEIAAIKAKTDNLPSDPADASDIAASFASLNTKVDTIDDFLDTEVAAIKTKTDQLTFTVAGQVDSNIQSVNDTLLEGDGSTTPWGPA